MGCYDYALRAQDVAETGTGPATNIALVILHDQPFAEGIAASSRYSKTKAATKAIQKLQGLSAPEFRTKYRCDCRAGTQVPDAEAMVVDDSAERTADLEELEEPLGTAI